MTQMETAPPPAQPAPPQRIEPVFRVSSPPHLFEGTTTRQIMYEVCAAMIPLFIVSVVMFGVAAIVLVVATVAGCLATEALFNWARGHGQSSLKDGSAVVTGLILAFSLPPTMAAGNRFYMAFMGGVVAIALAKMVFGGLGQNLFNPAMVGRAFLMVCFPAAMVNWQPTNFMEGVDAMTMATPLYAAAKGEALPGLWALLIGNVGGSLGETSALAALLGGLYLVFRRIADWRQPVAVLGTVAIFAAITHLFNSDLYPPPSFHLLSGALMFGAFFIATDYVGAPVTPLGRWIFGVGVGVLVMVIRLFGAYPEGFMFAILIMNAVTPLIERWTRPTPFGGHVQA